jgi:Tfp pilus assembly PilM family ATPase
MEESELIKILLNDSIEADKRINSIKEEQKEKRKDRMNDIIKVLDTSQDFYSFNNVNNTIDSLYYCGGGARYGELIDALKETLDLPVRSVAELLPEVSLDEEDEWIDSPQAYGVLLA